MCREVKAYLYVFFQGHKAAAPLRFSAAVFSTKTPFLWSGLRQRLADAGLCGAISGLEFSDVTAAERERSGHQQQASWLTAANVSYGPPPLSHF